VSENKTIFISKIHPHPKKIKYTKVFSRIFIPKNIFYENSFKITIFTLNFILTHIIFIYGQINFF